MSSDCIEWSGTRTRAGYGVKRINYILFYAHRLAYQAANGVTLMPDQHVLHACDNPPCVNPDHLSMGTHADNMRDMALRGRSARGARLPQTKLTDDQVAEIRQLKRDGMKQRHIAAAYRVSESTISELVNQRRRVS